MWITFSKLVLCIYFSTTITKAYYDYKNGQSRYYDRRRLPSTTTARSVSARNYYNSYDMLRLRHQPRFSNLDRVNSRLDNINNNKKYSAMNSYNTKVRHGRWNARDRTTTTTTSHGLFEEEYDELEYEDESNEDSLQDEKASDSNGNDLDYINEDVTDDDDDNDPFNVDFDEDDTAWQAEEPTERPTERPATISSFSEYKWRHFGSRNKVEESRKRILAEPANEHRGVNAVLAHYIRVRQMGECRKPQPRVISIQDEHPDPTRTYSPQCTVLHRCTEDTGCCNHASKCQYKTRELVYLYFYIKVVKTMDITNTTIQKLPFYNHTECECRTSASGGTTTSASDIGYKSASVFRPENIRRCKCPEEFEPRIRSDSTCSCECKEDNQACLFMKKGKEFLSLKDRKCISSNQCSLPTCEYGSFRRETGRCPRKQEKLEEYKLLKIN